ncbi:MAG: DnaJ domain-containing protein, partial [Flammeovirgaceae bacterium]
MQTLTQGYVRGFLSLNAAAREKNRCIINYPKMHFRMPGSSSGSKKKDLYGKFIYQFKENFLEILGVVKGANKDDIKKAYFKLAKQYHPDVNKTPEA